MVAWAAVVFGLLLIGAIYYLPVVSVPFLGDFTVAKIVSLCSVSRYSDCGLWPSIYYGGLISGIVCILLGFVWPSAEKKQEVKIVYPTQPISTNNEVPPSQLDTKEIRDKLLRAKNSYPELYIIKEIRVKNVRKLFRQIVTLLEQLDYTIQTNFVEYHKEGNLNLFTLGGGIDAWKIIYAEGQKSVKITDWKKLTPKLFLILFVLIAGLGISMLFGWALGFFNYYFASAIYPEERMYAWIILYATNYLIFILLPLFIVLLYWQTGFHFPKKSSNITEFSTGQYRIIISAEGEGISKDVDVEVPTEVTIKIAGEISPNSVKRENDKTITDDLTKIIQKIDEYS